MPLAGTGEFWQDKPFTHWTNEEVNRMLTTSPWAARVESVPNKVQQHHAADIVPGVKLSVVVRWQSARPVRQALIKSQLPMRVVISPTVQQLLSRDESFHAIALDELPPTLSRADLEPIAKRAESATFLRRKGRPSLRPHHSEIWPGGKSNIVLFMFPRRRAITAAEREVEFTTRLGRHEIRHRFRVTDMLIGGVPAL